VTVVASTNLNALASFEPIHPEIVRVTLLTPDAIRLDFTGCPGEVYTLQRSADVGVWSNLMTAFAAADGTGTLTVGIDGDEPRGYFRLRWH
jgi:hypothetical protein